MRYNDLSIVDKSEVIVHLSGMPFDSTKIDNALTDVNPHVSFNDEKKLCYIPYVTDFKALVNHLFGI